jgi:hypothetical protein
MELVPHSALQLPPGCRPPPPAAFFLVEQLLRREPSAATMDLALQLLRGSASLLTSAGQQLPPEQQQQQSEGEPAAQHSTDVAGRQAGRSQLALLAYCSLAISLAQACVQRPQLAAGCMPALLELVRDMSPASEDSNSDAHPYLRYFLTIRIVAAIYTSHAGCVAEHAAAGSPASDNINRPAEPTVGPWSSSGDIGSVAAVSCSSACVAGGSAAIEAGALSPADGSVCFVAAVVLWLASCNQRGVPPPATPPRPAVMAAFAAAAQQRGTTLQQHLAQQLQALACQYPMPHACGNVLCGRLEGPSAAGAVVNRPGTLCGGCRAAWYCCEECREVAREAHRVVCGAEGST